MITAIVCEAIVPADQAATSKLSLPKNPAVGGRPVRLKRNTANNSAAPGRSRPSPASSSSCSTWRSRPLMLIKTANAPTVMNPYTAK